MKSKLFGLAFALLSLLLLLCSCKNKIESVEELTEHDLVLSVEALSLETDYRGVAAYDMRFLSGELQMQALILLPEDYKQENYPLLLYFPEVGPLPENLISMFTKQNVGVICLLHRGYGESEGSKDLGGTDYTDGLTLLSICRETELFADSDIFLVGSAEGSIAALKIASEASDKINGCAVINVISDLALSIELQGNSALQYYTSVIGASPEEAPEEYARRSAINFADKIRAPLLLLAYRNQQLVPIQYAIAMQEAMEAAGGTSELYMIEPPSSDFYSKEAQRHLLAWIHRNRSNTPSENGKEPSSALPDMQFVFKNGETTEEQEAIMAEARSIMAEIHRYLGVELYESFTPICTFDENYVSPHGENRSIYQHLSGEIYCRSYEDFVHEYMHYLCFSAKTFAYQPDDWALEGFATYVAYIWDSQIRSAEYAYFKAPSPNRYFAGNETENAAIAELINQSGHTETAIVYNKAILHYANKILGLGTMLQITDPEIIKYYIGCLLTEYLIEQNGGLEVYLSFYGDSMRIKEIYGKDYNNLLADAFAWNASFFSE